MAVHEVITDKYVELEAYCGFTPAQIVERATQVGGYPKYDHSSSYNKVRASRGSLPLIQSMIGYSPNDAGRLFRQRVGGNPSAAWSESESAFDETTGVLKSGEFPRWNIWSGFSPGEWIRSGINLIFRFPRSAGLVTNPLKDYIIFADRFFGYNHQAVKPELIIDGPIPLGYENSGYYNVQCGIELGELKWQQITGYSECWAFIKEVKLGATKVNIDDTSSIGTVLWGGDINFIINKSLLQIGNNVVDITVAIADTFARNNSQQYAIFNKQITLIVLKKPYFTNAIEQVDVMFEELALNNTIGNIAGNPPYSYATLSIDFTVQFSTQQYVNVFLNSPHGQVALWSWYDINSGNVNTPIRFQQSLNCPWSLNDGDALYISIQEV